MTLFWSKAQLHWRATVLENMAGIIAERHFCHFSRSTLDSFILFVVFKTLGQASEARSCVLFIIVKLASVESRRLPQGDRRSQLNK